MLDPSVESPEPRPSYVPRNWKKAYTLTVLSFGCLLNGFSIGFFVPGFKSLLHGTTHDIFGNRVRLPLQDLSWISALLNMGALFGYLIGLWTMERIGRRRAALANASTFAVGYLATALSVDRSLLFASRLIVGGAVGGTLAVTGVYSFEISGRELHGVLGVAQQALVALGVLLAVSVGSCVDWPLLAVVFLAALLAPYAAGVALSPESPAWLVRRGREFSAARSIEWLEGRRMASAELDGRLAAAAKQQQSQPSLSSLRRRKRELASCLGLVVAMQLSGFNVLVYYSVVVFDMSTAATSPNLAAVVSLVCLMASFAVVVCFTFRMRRKPVLVASMVGMAACQFGLGGRFVRVDGAPWHEERYNQTVQTVQALDFRRIHGDGGGGGGDWIPVALVSLCLFLGNTGWFSVTWAVVGELVPDDDGPARAAANRIVVCAAYAAAFVSAKTFADLVEAVEPHGAFFVYGCVCLVGAAFTQLVVPETKKGDKPAAFRRVPTAAAEESPKPILNQELVNNGT